LAADTPVFPGGAVVFSLALSLAELFEKAMERERERERGRQAYKCSRYGKGNCTGKFGSATVSQL